MPLTECKLCGRVYTHGGRMGICPRCIMRLEELYGRVHEYMRDNEDEDFDVHKLAEDMEENPADIQALVDLGYIERDLSLYGTQETKRKKLAQAFQGELDKMHRDKAMFYGGEIYSRSYDRNNDRDNDDGFKVTRRRV